jgi:hypothetical protein
MRAVFVRALQAGRLLGTSLRKEAKSADAYLAKQKEDTASTAASASSSSSAAAGSAPSDRKAPIPLVAMSSGSSSAAAASSPPIYFPSDAKGNYVLVPNSLEDSAVLVPATAPLNQSFVGLTPVRVKAGAGPSPAHMSVQSLAASTATLTASRSSLSSSTASLS